MNTEAINIKIDRKTKQAAQELASELGFSLSSIVKGYLRNFIKTKTLHLSSRPEEEPSEYLLQMLRESDEDVKAGRYREFHSPKEELEYLDAVIADAKRSGHR